MLAASQYFRKGWLHLLSSTMDGDTIYSWKPQYDNIVFDLGDVLFNWSPPTQQSLLSPKILRSILHSVHWFEYEKGNLGEDEVYSLVAEEFGVAFTDVKSTLQAARESLKKNPTMLEITRQLKGEGLNIYALSNISAPDWEVLSKTAAEEDWSLFTQVFTS